MLLGIEDLALILIGEDSTGMGMCSNCAVKSVCDILQVDGKHGLGRPKLTWKQLTGRNRKEWKLSASDPHGRHTCGSGVRSAMRAASQLPGRGSTDVDVAPCICTSETCLV